MPNAFIPLYDLVSFSTVPYAAARARAAQQDRIIVRVGIAAAGLLVALLVVAAFVVMRRMFASQAA
jgi:kynurenine 3-monooxygenase